MMSKRSGTSQLQSPPKRPRSSQPRLDQFFSSSPQKNAPPEIIDVDGLDDISDGGTMQSKESKPPSRFMTLDLTEQRPDASSYSALLHDPVFFNPALILSKSTSGVPYSFLAYSLSTISATRSRITIINVLTNTLRAVAATHPESLVSAIYLLSNTLAPPYHPIELGIGFSVISQAIQHVSGLSGTTLKNMYATTGDLGDVALEAKSKTRTLLPHPPLLINTVYDALMKIATLKGKGAAKQKQALVEKLLVAAKGEEVRFLVRTLCQNLRVGAVRTSILNALARAMVLTPTTSGTSEYHVSTEFLSQVQPIDPNKKKKKQTDTARDTLNDKFSVAESLLRTVYAQHPDYGRIVPSLFRTGLDCLLGDVPLTLGVPMYPALGSPIRSLDEIYDSTAGLPFTAEFKYDGQRAMIHFWKGDGDMINVRLFSRHLEDMTGKYPDVVALIEAMVRIAEVSTSSFIMDSEIVAIDPETGDIKNFQELSSRARKDVKLNEVIVPVSVLAFDLMLLDGTVLVDKPLRERRNLLRSRFSRFVSEDPKVARFGHVESCESEGGRTRVEEFWSKAVSSRCEGLMVKLLDETVISDIRIGRKKPSATYDSDTRLWFKLKRDYISGAGDSLDLVPIGAWYGNGRKAKWWSPILLGVYDPDSGCVVAVCKCMSGFTDSFYRDLSKRYTEQSDLCSKSPRWAGECDFGGFRPHVFFQPSEVWEIKGADVTLSPVSVAACGLVPVSSKGLSLRFPRFVRKRDDKTVENASTPQFLANMWRSQQGNRVDGNDDGDLVDATNGSEEVEEEEESEGDFDFDEE